MIGMLECGFGFAHCKHLPSIKGYSQQLTLKSECPENQKLRDKFQNFKIAQTLAISGPY